MAVEPEGLKKQGFLSPLEPVLQSLAAGERLIRLTGLSGPSARAWMAAGLFRATARRLLIVLPTQDRANLFRQDLECWLRWWGGSGQEIASLPEMEFPLDQRRPPADLAQQYLKTLYRAGGGAARILVAPATVLVHPFPDRESFFSDIIRLSTGESMDRDALIEKWVERGYRRVELVELPGEFALHGGIVDLFSPAEERPVRIEWDGDRIEAMQFFDPDTQLSQDKAPRVALLPIRLPFSDDSGGSSGSIADYLGPDAIEVWEGPETCRQEVRAYFDRVPPGSPLTNLEETFDREGPRPRVWMEELDLAPPSGEKADGPLSKTAIPVSIRTSEALGLGRPGLTLTESLAILEKLRPGSNVIVAAKSQTQQQRLLDLFHEHDLPAVRFASDLPFPPPPPSGGAALLPFRIAVGVLSGGFSHPETGLAVFTDEDLFGKTIQHRPPTPPKKARFFSSLEDLQVSDCIVHVQHGIGQYQGIRRLTMGGFESDFLVIRYRGGDTLYVPLDRMNLIQKYIGVEGRPPVLDRLGGSTWARATKRVKKAVDAIAKDLLDLYAAREVCVGHAFPPDDALAREFEAGFEFEETPDQFQAILDIKRDMERDRPMDRLICGDVGYGKTEVAMRAVFKAVMDGRQTAVLVPTTILADQHHRTFRQRFSPFPVRVEMISRFLDPARMKTILSDLAVGKVDIVIGTHRLLQKDVKFHRLGLVVVDEEQRFGVAHKERLKQLRKSVDVLTLSATPIPRTLQMSLFGIRDLSVIETPPPDRRAVRTTLARFDPTLIRTAVLRELARGGQVFFVHNRIEDIERIGRYLKERLPGVRIAIAHGQMQGHRLESIMLKFIGRQYDVLLSTAIIESGLDIPTANTIFVNNAHRFGLADLYQLRGRVGRSDQQAYAYFLVPSEQTLGGEAKRRLAAIQEFCDLGSGFRIAARDLEIRGAGHLLGKKQSGHLAAVGFEYLLKMIENAVREIKGQAPAEAAEPALDLQVSAFIPEDYIKDVHQRLSVYKRLSDILEEKEAAALEEELTDRYGRPPETAARLFEVVRLRLLARKLGVARLSSSASGVSIAFDPGRGLNEKQVLALLRAGNGVRFLSEFSLRLELSEPAWPEVFAAVKNCLQSLLQFDYHNKSKDDQTPATRDASAVRRSPV